MAFIDSLILKLIRLSCLKETCYIRGGAMILRIGSAHCRHSRSFFMRLFVINLIFVHACAAGISLHRIFHHGGINTSMQASRQHLELAQLVFYFDQEPMINRGRVESANGYEKIELFFPKAELKGIKAEDLVKEQKNADGALLYSVRCERTGVGVKCTVLANKQYIVFDYDTFLSISLQHAVRLHFFNKSLLDKMNNPGTLLRVARGLRQKAPCIVVDCGHGGHDAGAVGCGGLREKDLTLALGTQVSQLLRQSGFEVCMTRNADRSLSLDARTAVANKHDACALVSIHANSSKNQKACGIETFCLAPTIFKSGYGQTSLYGNTIRGYHQELYSAGELLARSVHAHVISAAQRVASTHDRQIKKAGAQILLGAQMPATLIEIGFLSNGQEARLLADERYQKLLAYGISNGIIAYYNNHAKKYA